MVSMVLLTLAHMPLACSFSIIFGRVSHIYTDWIGLVAVAVRRKITTIIMFENKPHFLNAVDVSNSSLIVCLPLLGLETIATEI